MILVVISGGVGGFGQYICLFLSNTYHILAAADEQAER